MQVEEGDRRANFAVSENNNVNGVGMKYGNQYVGIQGNNLVVTSSATEKLLMKMSLLTGLAIVLNKEGNKTLAVQLDGSVSFIDGEINQFNTKWLLTTTFNPDYSNEYPELTSDYELAVAGLIYTASIGLILNLGIGPSIIGNESKIQRGLIAVIKTSKRAEKAIDTLVEAITKNKAAVATAALVFLGVLYEEGLLLQFVKIALEFAGWYLLGEVLVKLFEVIFLPELEAAQVLAGFVVWVGQMIEATVKVINSKKSVREE